MKLVCLALLLCLAAIASGASLSQGGLRIPLGVAERNGVRPSRHSLFSKKLHNGTIPLNVVGDFYYYGNISIGTPAQYLTVDFDTGSPDLWVPIAGCDGCTGLLAPQRFNETGSSTFKKTTTSYYIKYFDGTVAIGKVGYDRVCLADYCATHQGFGAIDFYTSRLKSDFAGLQGLSFDMHTKAGKPFFQNLFDEHHIRNPIFAFWLNRNPHAQAQKGGELTLGFLDKAHYKGEIQYTQVKRKSFWEIQLKSAVAKFPDGSVVEDVGKYCLETEKCEVLADTGTSFTVGFGFGVMLHKLHVAKLVQPLVEDVYYVKCQDVHKLPTVHFAFGGEKDEVKTTLEPYHYTFPYKIDGEHCARIVALQNGPSSLIILGDSFLGKYYSVYDVGNSRVGFAESKFH